MHDPRLRLRPGIIVVVAGLAIFLAGLSTSRLVAEDEQSDLEIEIIGYSEVREGVLRQWGAELVRRPTAKNAEGYEPRGLVSPGSGSAPLPTEWEMPVTFRWSFGDRDGWIETGERPSLSYRYADSGGFTVVVEAWNEEGKVNVGTREVTVENRRPWSPVLNAVQIDPAAATFELTLEIEDAEDEELEIVWDFGDGESESGDYDEKWRVTHDYPISGTYPVSVTVTDDDGGERTETMEIVAVGGSEENEDTVVTTDEPPPAEGVATSFEATISGSIGTDFRGEVRSMAGLHLAPVHDGSKCRFMFTAWDPSILAEVIVILDLIGLPDEGGATYRFRPGGLTTIFHPDADEYQGDRRSLLGQFQDQTFGEILAPLAWILSDDQRSALGEQVGVEPGPREEQEDRGAPASVSPLGIEEHEGFEATGGMVELDFVPYDRAIGTIDLILTNTADDSSHPSISMKGEFALDLEAARRDGMMLYKDCQEATFAVDDVSPEPKEEHVYHARPRVIVDFSDDFDVDSLDDSTFQLAFPEADSGELVPVETRIFRRDREVFLEPREDLYGGVEYTARVKTGEDGVRSRRGVSLEDEDGTGWYSWKFTTRVDVEPKPGETENLSCHVFQTVRDAPLIAGKPAVARVYADWKEHPEVDPDAQVKEFTARVVINEVASDYYTFVRPDLWSDRGIDQVAAEHTANLYWTPDREMNPSLRVALEVPGEPGESHQSAYWTRCVTPLWEHEPELTVEYYMLAINEWEDEARRQALEPVMDRIANEAEVFAEQVLPLKSVYTIPAGVRERPLQDRIRDRIGGKKCPMTCAQNLLFHHAGKSGADVVVGFVPMDKVIGGGSTPQELGSGGPGVIIIAIDDDPAHFDRLVNGLVHEIGHALWLEHLPYVDEAQRAILRDQRNEAWDSGGQPVHWHQGIEGFRIARDGREGWNKSSTEGNEEGSWLTPLMFPATIPYKESFIARHQYLMIQEEIDNREGRLR